MAMHSEVHTETIDNLGDVIFRPMLFQDVPAVYQVESACYDFPWTEKLLHDCVRVGYNCWVVQYCNQIIGYAIYRLAVGEAHLFNIAIQPDYQNKGICSKFLEFLLTRMKQQQALNVLLEVRVSNTPARKLYKSFNFKEIGVRKGYYPGPNNTREDGLNLELVFD